MNKLRRKYGFSLTEILIVVAILGILAAVVLPLYQNNTQKARESAAKQTLQIVRNAIELYASKNNGIAPGYPGNNINAPVVDIEFYLKMLKGGYLASRPKNPFNQLTTIKMIKNVDSMPATATGQYGWIYKPLTKTIKLDWPNTDSQGVLYYDY
jgi:prepilin-type N-terminal cleavage/methylation domain-containing protein